MIDIVHTMTHFLLFLHLSQAQVAHHTHLSQVQDLVIVHQETAYLVTALQVYHQRGLQVSDPARLLVALFHLTTAMILNYHKLLYNLKMSYYQTMAYNFEYILYDISKTDTRFVLRFTLMIEK